ncbi:MAG: AAA family ATPase [candidate division Zixibacteria bacterium]|nr:AAA family ATPase [candidate division Zixibacteria bacterium]
MSELKIWNFRKYGSNEGDAPGLHLKLNKGLNLLVGENDSGKTAIIDAIKYILQTQSHDYQWLEEKDFFLQPDLEPTDANRAKSFRIECIFRGFDAENNEAANFIEWLGIEKDRDGQDRYFLKVTLNAERKERKIIPETKAGPDDEGTQLDAAARDYLRTTYLKPLRDAESELVPGRRSRLAQILKSHEAFRSIPESEHTITKIAQTANKQIDDYFKGRDEKDNDLPDQSGKELLSDINEYLKEFFTEKEMNKIAKFALSGQDLSGILEKLTLNLAEENSGLGSYNRLYIATELLLLKRTGYYGLKLSLIEEVETHLHPQAQLRLIEYLQEEIAAKSGVQLIMTTHSPNLASKVKLDNLIICKGDKAFPMGSDFTQLEKGDYLFLERFLDVTKANLFFAQGVILVEGDAENILIPVVAAILDKPLTKHGVSVVNVQSTAFLRYSRIFKRRLGDGMGVKVAVITDNDPESDSELSREQIERKRSEKESKYSGPGIRTFVSPVRTLEYDICLSSLKRRFYMAVLCAEKIKNSDAYGLTETKFKQVIEKVRADFNSWTSENKTDKQIAEAIYNDYVIKKKISKPIVAQCFAALLEKCRGIKERIEVDSKVKYLVDAINYVAE